MKVDSLESGAFKVRLATCGSRPSTQGWRPAVDNYQAMSIIELALVVSKSDLIIRSSLLITTRNEYDSYCCVNRPSNNCCILRLIPTLDTKTKSIQLVSKREQSLSLSYILYTISRMIPVRIGLTCASMLHQVFLGRRPQLQCYLQK